MRTLILYESTHHGNTKKLCDAIAALGGVTLMDVSGGDVPWEMYDTIGFASGIAFGKFYPRIRAAAQSVPAGKQVFFLYTCGQHSRDFSSPLQRIAQDRGCRVLGSYGCRGFDTFGPFRLVGGISKGHPDETEIRAAVDFYRSIMEKA